MVKFVKSFVMDESGASAAEYALILAVIGSVIVVAALGLAGSIGTAMDNAGSCISNPVSTNAAC
jgi:pilus assembly protein Flp/PilA